MLPVWYSLWEKVSSIIQVIIVDDAPIAEMRWAFLFVVEVVLLAMKRWDFETSTAVIFYNEMLIS